MGEVRSQWDGPLFVVRLDDDEEGRVRVVSWHAGVGSFGMTISEHDGTRLVPVAAVGSVAGRRAAAAELMRQHIRNSLNAAAIDALETGNADPVLNHCRGVFLDNLCHN